MKINISRACLLYDCMLFVVFSTSEIVQDKNQRITGLARSESGERDEIRGILCLVCYPIAGVLLSRTILPCHLLNGAGQNVILQMSVIFRRFINV